jgi:hypothetical protein
MNNKRKRKQNDGNERSNDSVTSPLSKQNDNNKPLDEREKCNSDMISDRYTIDLVKKNY